jgi:hypothetical protein
MSKIDCNHYQREIHGIRAPNTYPHLLPDFAQRVHVVCSLYSAYFREIREENEIFSFPDIFL